jgi:alpha-beta hydrolase superfamily lysophospholipase/SAM-dependent methyltransferase
MTLRSHTEHTFASHDAAQLFYRHWAPVPAAAGTAGAEAGDPPALPARPRALVLLHRGHEHGGRMAHLADEFDLPDFHVFAWDARGLGRSPGERGYAGDFGVLVKDVDVFMQHIAAAYGIAAEDIAVVAQSVGAVLAATWVHDYAPAIRGLVLASPAFKVKLYVPFARSGLALMHKLRGPFFVNSYVKAKYLTHDAQRIRSYDEDPLITRPIAVNILLGLYDAADRVIADAAAIHTPTQMLVSGSDWVVHHKPQFDFLDRLSSPIKESHVFDGFFHDTLGEKDRHLAVAKARDFILRCFSAEPALAQARPALLDADRGGYTRRETDRLRVPPDSPAMRAWWGLGRAGMRAGSIVSEGMQLGAQTGFDSGSTLDYVYRNQPAGRGALAPLGRLADRFYLESIGWRGIRVRKQHLEKLIVRAVRQLAEAGRPVRVVDIAAGHGRYVLEALAPHRSSVASILLRDYSLLNVTRGQELIAAQGLQDIAAFVQADAFDRGSLASLAPRPTLAIVSGLYELFPDNALIRASLGGLAQAMEPGARLIYTNQPWHPQLEMIARTLTSHREGQPWIMRRRSQAEMDALVADAGFDKMDQLSDPWGIFSVSIAVRRAAA